MTTKARILNALKTGPMTGDEIAKAIDHPIDLVRPYMTQLHREGKVTRDREKGEGQRPRFRYTRADAPAT